MKKILPVLFVVLLFVACRGDDAEDYSYSYDNGEEIVYGEIPYEDAYDTTDTSPYELCYCGEAYVHELRLPTPPMNIHEIFAPWQGHDYGFPHELHEANIAEFVRDFENVHTATEIQWETDWYETIVLWSDAPLRDFSFVSLDTAGHEWYEVEGSYSQLIIGTQEVLLTVDELLPTDAVILNVNFFHYLLPYGAIIFTDEDGLRWRMFIRESMRGGCFPLYHLGEAHLY